MLTVSGVSAAYGHAVVLHEVDLAVAEGSWVAVLGAAGAGKSTLMKVIAGLLPTTAGTVTFRGRDLASVAAHERVRLGIGLVPERRRLFTGMTVKENLVAGAYTVRSGEQVRRSTDEVFALFPVLAERQGQVVGTLSGGEQQMCAIGRALMARPSLLLIDELSLGLAPRVVDTLLETLETIRAGGTTLLVVEQDVRTILAHAGRVYVLQRGRVVRSGVSDELAADPEIVRHFLGV